MNTIHIEGVASNIDITESFTDNYDQPMRFSFGEESTDLIPRVFFRFYSCDKPCALSDAIQGSLKSLFGTIEATGQEYGYSEYTIDGFNVNSLTLGGHDLNNIIKQQGDKYLHILIDVIPERNKPVEGREE